MKMLTTAACFILICSKDLEDTIFATLLIGTTPDFRGRVGWGGLMLIKVTRREISSQENREERSQVFLPQQGYQEVNIFLSLERNPSLSSPASRLSLLPAELSMVLPPGHKQQKEPSQDHTPPYSKCLPRLPMSSCSGAGIKEQPTATLRLAGGPRVLA